ncbi:MAG: HetP family heterocyst commitment protein [Chroococcales cyanobacterium]
MTSRFPSYNNSQRDRAMNEEQFEQVVEAILDGKYSWACVLILRFAGYNPLHYIPYRTYNRLQKKHESNSSKKTVKGDRKKDNKKELCSKH